MKRREFLQLFGLAPVAALPVPAQRDEIEVPERTASNAVFCGPGPATSAPMFVGTFSSNATPKDREELLQFLREQSMSSVLLLPGELTITTV